MSVTLVILNWNSREHLMECLRKLEQQTILPSQVLIIDNGSQEQLIDHLEEQWPKLNLHVERLDSNIGFAKANNMGARLARGRWLALLNSDAFPEPEWLEQLLLTAEQNPDFSSFSSRQIQYNSPRLLDGAGDSYHISGLAWRNGYKLSSKTYGLQQKEVFSPCAAAALYAREEFLKAGGFDENYFSYFEDVDLGFRLRLGGAKCLYVPEAIVYHIGSGSTSKRSDFSVYYGYRNMIWTFVKDMPSPLLWIFLPLHIGTLLFFVTYLTWRGQGAVILRAIRDAIHGLPKMIEKRWVIQRNKKITSGELLRVMSTDLLEPYREFIQRNKNNSDASPESFTLQ